MFQMQFLAAFALFFFFFSAQTVVVIILLLKFQHQPSSNSLKLSCFCALEEV